MVSELYRESVKIIAVITFTFSPFVKSVDVNVIGWVGIHGRARGQGGCSQLVDYLPRDIADAAHGWFRELVEGVGGEVEIADGARLASVHQQDMDGLVLVYD